MTDERPGPIGILHEDERFVVVDKPGGLLVHRTRESTDRVFLLQEVGRQLGCHVFPVHRLDRAVSGALVMAFSSDATRRLQASLTATDAVKEYVALVRGETPEAFESDRPLTDKNGRRKPARSEFERIATLSRCSLLRVRIHTGRRHQIRRHLSHLAHQIIGDSSHGKGKINRFFRDTYGLPRLFLHAARIEFLHPWTEERLEVRAPLASDLREFLLRLPDADPAVVAGL